MGVYAPHPYILAPFARRARTLRASIASLDVWTNRNRREQVDTISPLADNRVWKRAMLWRD
jgi:hypothetical protein